jgi:hypothetical protein
VLHDVGGRIFFEQPAREDLNPALCGIGASGALIDDQLHKSTLILIGFPWRGFFAGAHADHHLAETNGFARL